MTSRRSFLAALVAAIAGRPLFRKPAPASSGRRGDGSLFNPRENAHAQWAASRYDFPVFYGGPGGNVDV